MLESCGFVGAVNEKLRMASSAPNGVGLGKPPQANAWDAMGGRWRFHTPNSSLRVRPVVALAWAMARSSALFFGCEKPCAVPL